jgi:hypothetical protein
VEQQGGNPPPPPPHDRESNEFYFLFEANRQLSR